MERFKVRRTPAQVTQRPGCSRFATSVSTLTAGSQATARLSPERSHDGAEAPPRAAWAMGIRTSTVVADTPLSCSEMVWERVADRATLAGRSALAERLMAVAVPTVPFAVSW